jgi:hypothetical protein
MIIMIISDTHQNLLDFTVLYDTVWDNNEIIRMRHDATRHNATRKPCALTLRSRRAIRDSNEAPPALLAPEPVEPGRLKTGRNGSQNGETQNRNETNRETTRDDLRLEKFEVRSRIFQGKSFRVENIAHVIFASDSSWDFDTSDRPKKTLFLVFAIWVAAHQLVALSIQLDSYHAQWQNALSNTKDSSCSADCLCSSSGFESARSDA